MRFLSLVKNWLPVVGWLALMFFGSTDLMSAEHTSRFIFPFLHWLDPRMSVWTIFKIQDFIRKSAHLVEYAVLASLLYRALVNGFFAGRKIRSAAVALLICAAFALTDEYHQSFIPARTSSIRDVGIDLCGALLGLSICFLAGMGKRTRQMELG
jgi:VanZ family protein